MSEHRAAAGRALAALLTDGITAQLTGRDLAIASSARDSVLSSCEEMLAAVAGRTHRTVRPTIADLAQRPVTHLAVGLAAHPRLRVDAPAPTDLAAQPPATETAARWTAAAERLLIAAADLAPPLLEQPPAAAAWAVTADVAAITRAIDTLDSHLQTAHQLAGHSDAVALLGDGRDRGLGIVASTALDQAIAGDVDFGWRPRSARVSLHPVLSVSALPDSLDELDRMIRQAPVLRPADIAQLALGHHYLAVTTANTLASTAPTAVAQLRRVADTLAGAADGRPDVASLLPGDRRPVVQLGSILRTARQLAAGDYPPAPDRDAALGIARRLPGLLATIHTRAVGEVTAGRWLVPDHEPLAPTWQKATAFTPLRLTNVTASATQQASSLTGILGPSLSQAARPAHAVSAVVALAARPATAGRRPTRPTTAGVGAPVPKSVPR